RDWVLLLGKLLGLALVLAALMAMLTIAVMIVHVLAGDSDFQIGLALKMLFGLQLLEYLLFAVLVFVVQAIVNQKHLGMVAAFVVYICILFSSMLGIDHNLLVYGGSPDWSFTSLRGFGR